MLGGSNKDGQLKDFTTPLEPSLLNIEEKNRSNLFGWRGQFSPQLVEYLLDAYCLPGSIVLDPFAGSGTVLYEAASMSLPAYGFEINPAAWCFSKLYEFTNTTREERRHVLNELRQRLNGGIPDSFFSPTIVLNRTLSRQKSQGLATRSVTMLKFSAMPSWYSLMFITIL